MVWGFLVPNIFISGVAYGILEQELRLSDAFYEKDSSKLELVVKVKNCSDSKLLPIVKSCDILKGVLPVH